MNLSVGIIGLPNAGKSTLFNALQQAQGKRAQTGKHPFTTIEPNKGTVGVPDKRLDELYLLMQKEKRHLSFLTSGVENKKRPILSSLKTPVKLTFVDIAGLIKGANIGEGLGNKFLSHIRQVNCILHVVREFSDPTVAHIHEAIDPVNDLEIVRTELILKDLETIEKQLKDKKSGWIKKCGKKGERVLRMIKDRLNTGKRVADLRFTDEEKKLTADLFLLTAKPEIVVSNIGEEALTSANTLRETPDVLRICAKLEEELAGLKWTEKRQFLREFNLPEPALDKVIRACYKELNLLTFYTIVGGRQARAWALEKGNTIYEAAGKIHSDIQKGFIKAEVINVDKLLSIGSWSKAREKGKLKLHGRDYIVKNYDVVEIKFN